MEALILSEILTTYGLPAALAAYIWATSRNAGGQKPDPLEAIRADLSSIKERLARMEGRMEGGKE